MFIRDILSDKGGAYKGRELCSVASNASVAEAVTLMIDKDISSVLVLRDGTMAGLVTLREILRGLHQFAGKLPEVSVAAIMITAPIAGHPDDSVDHMRQVMTDNHITHLPVLEKGRLVGILSLQDLARSMVKDVALENAMLKQYIRNWPEQGRQ